MINNKLKNCCNDCVHCEIVTETKRRAIQEDKTEVVLVNIKCSHMCNVGKYDRIDNAYLCTCDKYKSRNPNTKEYKR